MLGHKQPTAVFKLGRVWLEEKGNPLAEQESVGSYLDCTAYRLRKVDENGVLYKVAGHDLFLLK